MCPHLQVKKQILVPCPAPKALDFLQNIAKIEHYEPKLSKATVYPQTDTLGSYDTHGYFAGLPWKGKFSYQLTASGFYSEMLEGPVPGLKVSGGFEVGPVGPDLCLVTHFERYEYRKWPLVLPLAPMIGLYLSMAMNQELKDIKQLILEDSYLKEHVRSDKVTPHA